MILIIPYMALMAVWSGGSLWPSQYLHKRLTWLPEAFFGLGVSIPLFYAFGYVWLISAIWAYIFMQSHTGVILPWRDLGKRNPDKDFTLKPVMGWLSKVFNLEFDSIQYAATYAALKGFFITLPIGGFGAIYWPLSYEIGYRLGHNRYSELATGFFTGLNIFILLSAWIE